MINVWVFSIPIYLIFHIFGAFLLGFLLWRNIKKFREKTELVFDFVFQYLLITIVFGRLMYMIQNFSEFAKMSWSIYPYFYLPGAERIWFKQMPFALIKFWEDGMDYSAMLLGGVVFLIIFLSVKKVSAKNYILAIRSLIISQIILIIGFFVGANYYGQVIDSVFSIQYASIDDQNRLPLQLIEIVILLLIFSLSFLIKNSRLFLGIFLFLIGWTEIVITYFLSDELKLSDGIGFTQLVYLLVVFLGIGISVFSFKDDKESDQAEGKQFLAGVEENVPVAPRLRTKGYRSFHTSFSTYRKENPSFLSRLKRMFSKDKKKEE